MTSDETRLRSYVDTWAGAVADVVALLRSLDEDDWSRPTDCPGWDVRPSPPTSRTSSPCSPATPRTTSRCRRRRTWSR